MKDLGPVRKKKGSRHPPARSRRSRSSVANRKGSKGEFYCSGGAKERKGTD